jgi:uncharacterized protein YegL
MADCSGSMKGEKIESLNRCIHEVIPELRQAQEDEPFAEILVRAISFSTGAQWHITNPTPVKQVSWQDLPADGITDLGQALHLLTTALTPDKMGRRNHPPVIILLSDGAPTDEWEKNLKDFNASAWGKPGRTVRVAIAIGEDADQDVLGKFTGNSEVVFKAQNAAQLRSLLRWATVTLSTQLSKGSSSTNAGVSATMQPPPAAIAPDVGDSDDVW